MKLAPGGVAVVTGAASGIGFALAAALTGRGLRVVVADVRGDAARQACALLPTGQTLAAEVDVRDPDAVAALAARTLTHFGRVDLVCNNAGVIPPRLPAWEQPVASWRWTLEVMVLGVAHGIAAFLPTLIAQGSGHVLNTASMGGLIALPGLAPYAAAKHAVVGLTETLAEELVGTGVGTTVLCPGFVPTGLTDTSALTRPAGVGHAGPPRVADAVAGSGATAADVAEAALAGVQADVLHVVVAAGAAAAARARVRRLLADLPEIGVEGDSKVR